MTRLAALFVAVLVSAGENDVLIVETVGFLAGVITAPVRHGDKLHVVEW